MSIIGYGKGTARLEDTSMCIQLEESQSKMLLGEVPMVKNCDKTVKGSVQGSKKL